MSDNGNDVFTRLNLVIDDWSAQIARSHEELSAQISVARGHLDNLLHPQEAPTPTESLEFEVEREALQSEIDRLQQLLDEALEAADREDQPSAGAPTFPSENDIADLRETLALRDAEIASLTEKLDAANAAAEQAAQEPVEAAVPPNEEALSQLREMLALRDAEVESLEEQLKSSAEERAQLNEELETARGIAAESTALPVDSEADDTALVEARLQLETRDAEIASLTEQLNAANAAAEQAAQEPVEAILPPNEEALSQLREMLALRDAEVDSLEEQLKSSAEERARLNEELEAARSIAAESTVSPVEIEADEAALTEARLQLETRDAEVAALREKLEAAQREMELFAAQLAAGQAGDVSLADADADTLKAALEMLQLEHAAAQDEIRTLKQDLDQRVAPGSIDAFDGKGHKKRMGEILVDLGVLSEVQLKSILKEQSADPQRRLGTLAVEHGFTTDELISRILAAQLRLPYEDLQAINPEPGAMAKVSAHVVRLHRCMPIQEEDGVLTVAMVNPLDLIAIEDLELASGCRVAPVVATREKIDALLAAHYPET